MRELRRRKHPAALMHVGGSIELHVSVQDAEERAFLDDAPVCILEMSDGDRWVSLSSPTTKRARRRPDYRELRTEVRKIPLNLVGTIIRR
jgi:hypothetical protein